MTVQLIEVVKKFAVALAVDWVPGPLIPKTWFLAVPGFTGFPLESKSLSGAGVVCGRMVSLTPGNPNALVGRVGSPSELPL